MKRFLMVSVAIICFVISAHAQKVKTINVIPDNAKIIIGGTEVASGQYNLTMGRGDYVILKLSAPGYIDKTVRVYKSDKSKTLTFRLEQDDAYFASDEGSDLANKTMRVVVRKGMSADEVWKRISYYITDLFPNIEVTDKSAGWIRAAWNTEAFAYARVRTRIEIKEMPGMDNLTYRIELQSEIAWKSCGMNDQCFSKWDRVLKKYKKAVEDLKNSLE
ncbi:MAG: hypothetical protein FWC41_12620 [Firmicutes bacterium]|nr:hypothetical protein [Bacillota bacterium]